eukprot:SAG22_NODE_2482_length_2526_cov_1.823651_4_plen_100_part_00
MGLAYLDERYICLALVAVALATPVAPAVAHHPRVRWQDHAILQTPMGTRDKRLATGYRLCVQLPYRGFHWCMSSVIERRRSVVADARRGGHTCSSTREP